MNGKQTGNEAEDETPKPHCVDSNSEAISPKESWGRFFVEKLVRFGKEWREYRRKYTRLNV
jgi:hypothetical protein